MGETERISPQIFVDVSFNYDRAMRIIRIRQDTQCGQAWPKPMRLRFCNSPSLHEQCYKPTVPAMPGRRRLNVNRAMACRPHRRYMMAAMELPNAGSHLCARYLVRRYPALCDRQQFRTRSPPRHGAPVPHPRRRRCGNRKDGCCTSLGGPSAPQSLLTFALCIRSQGHLNKGKSRRQRLFRLPHRQLRILPSNLPPNKIGLN
jgi:hypothetical protein